MVGGLRFAFAAGFAFGLIATDSNAAVDRPYQRQLELTAIIQDPNVTKVGVIEKIEKIEGSKFRISSERCVVEVSVENVSQWPPVPGGGSLHVSVGNPQCR